MSSQPSPGPRSFPNACIKGAERIRLCLIHTPDYLIILRGKWISVDDSKLTGGGAVGGYVGGG